MVSDLDNLTNRLFDNALTEPEIAQLNELLRTPQNCRRFIELSKLHYCLQHRTLPPGARAIAQATSAVHSSILESPSGASSVANAQALTVPGPPRGKRERWLHDLSSQVALTACAVLAASLLVVFTFWKSDQANDRSSAGAREHAAQPDHAGTLAEQHTALADPSSEFAARVVSISQDARWLNGAPGDFLMRLSTGDRLNLTQGVAKLEFPSGACAVLTAPVELELSGTNSVLLINGTLSGRSERGEFSVQTPSAYVVDVGTAFGVSVGGQGVTDVVVFEGEVRVGRATDGTERVRLTSGMSVRVDRTGIGKAGRMDDLPSFTRDFSGARPATLGVNELSFVDVISGSTPTEFRTAGSIDPETGKWATLPWSESKGVRGKQATGEVVAVDWNPWVQAIFLPNHEQHQVTIDLQGDRVDVPPFSGGAWGPVWARRRIDRRLDPLYAQLDRDVEGFWGAGTTTALLDRSRWTRDGIVGMHANVGLTIDLAAIRAAWATSLSSLRGVLAHLKQSHDSQPFHPDAKVTFQVFVDKVLRYERRDFCRRDGDAVFGVELHDSDQLLTLVVTDANDGPIYDRLVLIDPIFELKDN